MRIMMVAIRAAQGASLARITQGFFLGVGDPRADFSGGGDPRADFSGGGDPRADFSGGGDPRAPRRPARRITSMATARAC